VAKVFSTEFNQRLGRTLMEIIGLKGLHYHKDTKRSPVLGRIEHHYLHSIASTIGSGTSEIQRNVIAWRGLGLPR
jgi:alkylation response protein AidB-like acyl-CoA dehydrogenase